MGAGTVENTDARNSVSLFGGGYSEEYASWNLDASDLALDYVRAIGQFVPGTSTYLPVVAAASLASTRFAALPRLAISVAGGDRYRAERKGG